MKKYDAIIIGSGLGGLSAGATLAKAGKKVLVLEQHSLLGGCATCYKRKGILIDAGLHELEYGDPSTDMKHMVFKKLGLDKKLKFISLPSAWTVVNADNLNETYTIPHKNTQDYLISKFPHEEEGIKKYFKKIKSQAKLARKFPFDMGHFEFLLAPFNTMVPMFYNQITNKKVGDVLDDIIKDSKLKRILNANLSYYHYNPYKFIWFYHAAAQKNYYDNGVYVKGGAQSVSDSLASVIQENGGELFTNSSVEKIITKGNKALGVSYVNKGVEHEVYAEKIVANCSPYIVYEKLLKDIEPSLIKDELNFAKDRLPFMSLSSLYMIFDKDINEIYKDLDYSTFILGDEEFSAEFNAQNTDISKIPLEQRGIVFVNYSKVDSGLSDREDRHLGVCTFFSYYDEWDLATDEYKAQKERISKVVIKKLEKICPGIMQHCIHYELATPKTIERYTRSINGAIYGYDQDNDGESKRQSSVSKGVKNLYFASAYCFPGGGFTGAILGGYNTANKILKPYFFVKRIALYTILGTALGLGISYILG